MPDVLIIEDDDTLRTMLTDTLAMEGLSVDSASDGRSGIATFRRTPAHVVCTDLYLPEADGLDVLMELKREYPTVQIILMSGGGKFGNLAPLESAHHLGAVAVLLKPFSLDQFVAVVREALEGA
jgi:DNA-binding NtrC family response regulator